MTMIDEGILSDALRATADAFDVSDAAATRIVNQMRSEEPPPITGVTRLVRQPGRTRTVLIGAAALVIAVGVGVPLAAHETREPATEVRGAVAKVPSASSGLASLGAVRSNHSDRERIRGEKRHDEGVARRNGGTFRAIAEDRVNGRSRRLGG